MDEPQNGPELSAADWEIVKELVFQWETSKPGDLNAWLTEQGLSAAVRREAERLIRAAETSGSFMTTQATEEHLGVGAQHPARIGRYRVIEELGAGGLGVVYAAYDSALERKVAIKVLADQGTAGTERGKRLRWDAKAASSVTHPNIVVIHDIGDDGGRDFIVMECIEGQPLGKLITGSPLPPQTALKYALQIAGGLDAAHRAGIIHRDLKPNNVMISNDGVVKLLDFGLAKHDDPNAEHSSLPMTIEGHFAGTVSYVSPEQAQGKPVDNRGDIFSFGCILFEMLTGQRAFDGNTAVSVLGSILHQPAPLLRRAAPQLDDRFEAVISRCLRKDPAERFANVSEIIPPLTELVESYDTPSRVSARTRRRLARWGIVAGCASILVLLAIGVRSLAFRQAPERYPKMDQMRVTNDLGLASFPALSRDGKLQAYASDRAKPGTLNIWIQQWGQQEYRRLTFDDSDNSAPSFNPDGTELVYRSERDGGGLYRISTQGGVPIPMASGGFDGRFSPDGRWLAYWTGEVGGALKTGCAHIYKVLAKGGLPEELVHGFDAAAYPVWSATGDQVIFLGRKAGETKGDWWVADVGSGNSHPTRLLNRLGRAGASPPPRAYFQVPRVWLPDHTVLFTARTSDATNIWAAGIDSDGTVVAEPHHWTDGTDVEDFPDAAITPKATYAVYAALKVSTAIYRIRLDSNGKANGVPELLIGGLPVLGSPSLNRKGDRLSFVNRRPSGDAIDIVDLRPDGPGPPTPIKTSSGIIRSILSGDGNSLAWMLDLKGYIMPVKGGSPEQVCDDCSVPSDLTFDGKRAIFEGRTDELVLCELGEKPRPLFHFTHNTWMQAGGRFSPDERWVVFSGQRVGDVSKQILVAPVTPGGVVQDSDIVQITADKSSNIEPVWSPDGRRIYFLSNRDGAICIRAQDVDAVSKHRVGEGYIVSHFDHAGLAVRGPSASPQTIGLSASKNFLVLSLAQTTGNIWARLVLR